MTVDSWWSLPGPSRLLQRVESDLHEGRSCILALPRNLGDGNWTRRLEEARVVRRNQRVPLEELTEVVDPCALVAAHMIPSEQLVNVSSVQTLCEHVARVRAEASESRGNSGSPGIVVLEYPGCWPHWPRWRDFLTQWAQATRNLPPHVRLSFLVIVDGIPRGDLATEQDSLRVRLWDGVCDHTDMLLYAQLSVAEWMGPELHRRVVAGVVASLALWDYEVVDRLSAASLEEVIQPASFLLRMSKERGWTHTSVSRSPSWEDGHVGLLAGVKRLHSAAIAVLSDATVLQRRVWAGQVGVLLPFIEEGRVEIIRELEPKLQVPWPTRRDPVTEKGDLELVHLAEQIDRYRLELSTPLRRALPVLLRVRNALAHLESVDAETLRDERLLALRPRDEA